jgi:aspartate kinase
MNLIVQKYGGSILTDINSITAVGDNIIETIKRGNSLIAVVSALKSETDKLIDYANKISKNPDPREMDMLISTGEQKTGALLSLYLQGKGIPSISFTGHQIGIITDSEFGNASILKINAEKLESQLDIGKVIIVAGFQGVNQLEDITTLGRGGSDLTAVAIAALLKAEDVEFYKDTGSIFTVDPNFSNGKRIKNIDYSSLLELSKGGTGIITAKAVELAKRHNIPMIIRSLKKGKFTLIINEDFIFSDEKYLALSVKPEEYQLFVKNIDQNQLIKALSKDINVNYLDKFFNGSGFLLITDKNNLKATKKQLLSKKIDYKLYGPFSRISVIGWGFRNYGNFYKKIIKILNSKNIDLVDMHFSGYQVSLLIDKSGLKSFVDMVNRENHD